jgi:hypothetical protein
MPSISPSLLIGSAYVIMLLSPVMLAARNSRKVRRKDS